MKWLCLLLVFIPLSLYESPLKQDLSSVPCLAATIFHEASGEPPEGRRAVYEVILERMRRTGNSACEIVLAPKQFSGLTQEKIDRLEEKMLANFWEMLYTTESNCNCTHFHHVSVEPSWKHKFKFVKQISKHRFYIEEK